MRAVTRAVWWAGALLLMLAVLRPVSAGPPKALEYLERISGGADPKSALPMLIVLHGYGDSPENFVRVFEEVAPPTRIIAARAPDPAGSGSSWYPVDETPAHKLPFILERAKSVVALAQKLVKERPTLGKPVVAGFSQGGALALALAAYHSQHFTAAIPIAGTLYAGMPQPKRAAADFQVLAFHGRDDRRIPYDDGARTIKTLQDSGTRAFITEFPGVGHAIPEAMRAQIYAALRELLDQAQASAGPKRLAQPTK